MTTSAPLSYARLLVPQMRELQGDGLFSAARNAIVGGYKWFREGIRKGPTKRYADFLAADDGGQQIIVQLSVCRKPVLSGVRLILNALSLGGFDRMRRTLGYDQVYHNLLLIELAMGRNVVTEKNHIVEFREANQEDYKLQRGIIPVAIGTTFAQLVARASAEDPQRFWQYDARVDNCQLFTSQIARATGVPIKDPLVLEMLTPQDADALVASLGRYGGFPKQVTDLAAGLDRVQYGDGARAVRLGRKRVGGSVKQALNKRQRDLQQHQFELAAANYRRGL